jgi:anti-anti-sigma factor
MNETFGIQRDDRDDGIVILRLSGRLDAYTVSQLEQAINAAKSESLNKFVFEMSQLNYISSSGMRVLLTARSNAQKSDGDVLLCALSQNVREVLEMVGFTSVFQIHPTVDLAIESLMTR